MSLTLEPAQLLSQEMIEGKRTVGLMALNKLLAYIVLKKQETGNLVKSKIIEKHKTLGRVNIFSSIRTRQCIDQSSI